MEGSVVHPSPRTLIVVVTEANPCALAIFRIPRLQKFLGRGRTGSETSPFPTSAHIPMVPCPPPPNGRPVVQPIALTQVVCVHTRACCGCVNVRTHVETCLLEPWPHVWGEILHSLERALSSLSVHTWVPLGHVLLSHDLPKATSSRKPFLPSPRPRPPSRGGQKRDTRLFAGLPEVPPQSGALLSSPAPQCC